MRVNGGEREKKLAGAVSEKPPTHISIETTMHIMTAC